MIEKYNEVIMRNLRERLDLEPDDTSKDKKIMSMDKRKVFDEYLEWEGISGWTSTILSVIEDIFKVELE